MWFSQELFAPTFSLFAVLILWLRCWLLGSELLLVLLKMAALRLSSIPSLRTLLSSTASPFRLAPISVLSSSGYQNVVPPSVSSFLSDLWDSVLRAVPKKKTSHMKSRHRQMAGKALKDTLSINSCPGCGKPKRAHMLCPTCVSGE